MLRPPAPSRIDPPATNPARPWALGVDGTTAAEYATDLEGNLRSLLDRAKDGTYRAPPVRRVYIPNVVSAFMKVTRASGRRSP